MSGDDCDCEFDFDEGDGEESWHYARTCTACGLAYGALHCPHDVIQNKCPGCGWRSPGTRTALEALFGWSPEVPT